MTTAYNLTDTIIRSHKRSSATSTSAAITWSVFENLSVKDLPILAVINAYNHYMGGIDIANWYQANFTTLRPQNYCYWKSLFHWLLDIVLINSYLLAKASHRPQIEESKWYYIYWWFLEGLAKILMTYSETLKHNQISRSIKIYCIYCWKDQLNWKLKHQWQQWSSTLI